MDNIVVVKIEDNTVYLEFSDKSQKKYMKDNFLKEPYVGQIVEFSNNGLIIEKCIKTESNPPGVVFKVMSCVGLISIIFLYISRSFYGVSFISEIPNICWLYLILFFILLVIYAFSNNKFIKKVIKFMLILICIVVGVSLFFRLLAFLWFFIACLACL